MKNFKEIGLVNTKELFKDAYTGGYAIPAFNFVCLEQLQAIVTACCETRSPFILQSSANVRNDIGRRMVFRMAEACVEQMNDAGTAVPMALNLDHGLSFEDCKDCIDLGFSSVMIDGSMLSFEDNIELTKRVVDYAHKYDVCVEGELGTLSGTEEGVSHNGSVFTNPSMAEKFVKATGVDSLAISIGSSHGVVKVTPNRDGSIPELRFDILKKIEENLPGFPIVMHGSSAIPAKYVEMINRYGGELKQAQGIPEDQIRKAVAMSVCKVNVASDGWIAMTATIRRILAENKDIIDPRAFLKAARKEMTEVYKHKTQHVLFSAGRA